MPVRFWDFLFYASFGLVVTRSVAIAGVLLVFCYLIVPSVGGMLYSSRIGRRLAIGWIMGVVVSMLGMYLSVQFDLPTGAAIVCTFGIVLAVMAAVRPLVIRLAAASTPHVSVLTDTLASCGMKVTFREAMGRQRDPRGTGEARARDGCYAARSRDRRSLRCVCRAPR